MNIAQRVVIRAMMFNPSLRTLTSEQEALWKNFIECLIAKGLDVSVFEPEPIAA